MGRTEAGLKEGVGKIRALREEFWKDARVLGEKESLNMSLERAGRVADYLEFAEVLCYDAIERKESCGGHFREEFQTGEGEAVRDDKNFCHAAVWEYKGIGEKPTRHVEPLVFENVELATRSYK